MSLPVLIGCAGVLVAAVATGMLAGRCVRQPRIGFIVWTAATLALTIALAAQSMGFAGGFGPATFRAVQLFALLLAPLWLSWGLVEVAAANENARFGMRLISGALTVVATVILATDPLTTEPFSKAWPVASAHFQPVSRDTLDVVQAVAVLVAVATVSLAAIRASRGSGPPVTAFVPVVLAVLMTAGQRVSFPADAVYPLLSMLAAVLVWFAVTRVGEPSRRAAGPGACPGHRRAPFGQGTRPGRRRAPREPGIRRRSRPAAGQAPAGRQVPASRQAPAGCQAPASRQAPGGRQVPAGRQAPGGRQAPARPGRRSQTALRPCGRRPPGHRASSRHRACRWHRARPHSSRLGRPAAATARPP